MILDNFLEFADATAVSGAAATRNVGDVIDLQTPRDIGNVHNMWFYVSIDAAPTGATTVEFRLVSDSVETPATDGSATVHYSSGAVAIANLPAGKMAVMVGLPNEGPEYERYLGLQVVNVGASALAALQISSGLTITPNTWKAYAEGNN